MTTAELCIERWLEQSQPKTVGDAVERIARLGLRELDAYLELHARFARYLEEKERGR